MADQTLEIDPAVEEPPSLTFVRDYWRRKRGARAMPSRADIVPSELKPCLSYILLADVVGKGKDFRYRLIGSRLQDFFAGNPTGRLMSETLAPFGRETIDMTIRGYAIAVERRAPTRLRGSGSFFAQGAKLFDAMLTPLSDDGRDANMIFGTFVFVWEKPSIFADRAGDNDEAPLERALRA
jgi:hypothetical protein